MPFEIKTKKNKKSERNLKFQKKLGKEPSINQLTRKRMGSKKINIKAFQKNIFSEGYEARERD